MIRLYPLLLFFSINILSAQAITGRLTDAETGEPVVYAQLSCRACAYGGTITNSAGEFALEPRSERVTVRISHIYYRNLAFTASPGEVIRLQMQAESVELATATISAAGMEKIMLTLRRKLLAAEPTWWEGRGFYRQTTFQDTLYTELLEALVDVKVSPSGIREYEIDQGRYAQLVKPPEQEMDYFHFNNFSFLQRRLNWVDDSSTKTPLSEGLLRFYDLGFLRSVAGEKREVVVLEAVPREGTPPYLARMIVTVDLRDTLPRRMEIFHPITLNFSLRGAEAAKSELSSVIDFSSEATGPQLRSCRMKVVSTFPIRNEEYTLGAESLLYFFDATAVERPRRIKKTRNYKDLNRIKRKGYDPQFWEDHPVVAKTQLEHDILRLLEGENYRGNYRNQ